VAVFWRSRSARFQDISHIEALERRTLLSVNFVPHQINGTQPSYQVAAADVNGDGKLDIVTADFLGTVSIFLGNGDKFGTFQAPIVIHDGLANGATSLAVEDLNADGRPDVVVSSGGTNGEVAVLINNGRGAFKKPKLVGVAPNSPYSVVVGDFNGDGHPDIAEANSYGVLSVALGNGDGTFQPYMRKSLPNATGENSLAVGDFNKDGKMDLVDANAIFGKVTVLEGKGTRKFAIGPTGKVGISATEIATADFNRDGKLDLAVGAGDGSITVLLGNGDGSFQLPRTYTVATQISGIATGDVVCPVKSAVSSSGMSAPTTLKPA